MYTLPITCNQVWIILACVVFIIGLPLVFTYYMVDPLPFVLGAFMVGLPSAFGIGAFVWYSGVFIGKHVRCKCK